MRHAVVAFITNPASRVPCILATFPTEHEAERLCQRLRRAARVHTSHHGTTRDRLYFTRQLNDSPTTPTRTPASLSHDPVSNLHWLEFSGKPDDDTRTALKAAGWRWGGYRKAWYTNRVVPIIPPCIAAEEAGEVQYAAERADRLEARAQKHDAKATAAYERSHAAVEHIPLGQPILVGHSSERMHRAALKRSHAAMDESVRESKTAERLHDAAESSRRHQAWTETPEAMTRRAERLEAEYRAMRRSIERNEQEMATQAGDKGRADQLAASPDHQAYCQYAENTRRTAEELRAKIAAAGGIAADQLNAQVGDIVRIHGFTGQIVRVNPKTYTVRMSTDGWTLKLDRTRLSAILIRADGTKPEQQTERPAPNQPEEAQPEAPCVWCGRMTRDPQHVCQPCRDLDNGVTTA